MAMFAFASTKTVIAAAAGVLLAGSAFASGPLDLSTGSTSFGSTPAAGAFTEIFTFTLATASTVSGSVTSVVSGTQDVDFTSIAVSGPSGTFAFAQLLSDPFETWGLAAGSVLNPGAYTLTLIGTNSASAGSFAGNLAVTAVPEPATYGLMALGLAAMGGLVLRRNRG